MAQQTINVGTAPNDGTGTPLRTAFQYTNSNFSELYTAVGPSGNNIVVPGTATITGDLTVDTSTLKVDSANNRVGIGTATPGAGYSLDILGAAVGGIRVSSNNYPNLVIDSANSNGALIYIQEGGTTQARIGHLTAVTGLEFSGNNGTAATNVHYAIDSTGISTWKNVGGVAGTAMTLNATGLGVGTSPSYSIQSYGTAPAIATGGTTTMSAAGTIGASFILRSESTSAWTGTREMVSFDSIGNGADHRIGGLSIKLKATSGASSLTEYLQINPTYGYTILQQGNLGIGVTPSAWGANYKAFQIGAQSCLYNALGYITSLNTNAYENSSGQIVRIANGEGTRYVQAGGSHQWFYAANASAGTIGGFTQAMTLDSSGTLLVGTTSAGASGFRCYLSTDSGTTKWSVGPYVSTTNFAIVASGSAGGVYLNGTTATSWTALSDERFKDIIEPISNAVAKVGSLRAVIGKIKGDETNTRKSFLIAQDVESVLPEAVDASNPDRLGLAYTDVIPLLVAAIKELTARVQTLETR